MFVGEKGGRSSGGGTSTRSREVEGRGRKIGLPDLHFHDLRHTGNTLAAPSGQAPAS